MVKTTYCPSAFAAPSSGTISDADRKAIRKHSDELEAKHLQRKLPFFAVSSESSSPKRQPSEKLIVSAKSPDEERRNDMGLSGLGTTRNKISLASGMIEIFQFAGHKLLFREEKGTVYIQRINRKGQPVFPSAVLK